MGSKLRLLCSELAIAPFPIFPSFPKRDDRGEEEIAISPLLHEFIQTNLNLTNLTIYVRAGIQELKDDLQKLDQSLKSINWDLTTRFEIVIPRTSAKKYY